VGRSSVGAAFEIDEIADSEKVTDLVHFHGSRSLLFGVGDREPCNTGSLLLLNRIVCYTAAGFRKLRVYPLIGRRFEIL
jgi:hypothetical protein